MARTFVNLNPYEAAQLNRRANTLSPLDALLQGAQQGLELQQLPGKLQDQALARQLNNAMVAQRLQDLQNPEAALARKLTQELTLKGALNPDLGIQAAPTGLTGVTIANPSAITAQQQAALPSQELMDLRDVARAAGGADIPNVIPTATPGLPETPISAFGIQTGLNSNPNIPFQAKENKLNAQIAAINARAVASGVPIRYERGLNDEIIALPTRQVGGGSLSTIPLTNEAGEVPKLAPKPSGSRTGVTRSLTPNVQTKLLSDASAAGINPDDPKYYDEATQTYDFVRLSIDKGKAVRDNKRAENEAKASELKGRTKTDVDALNAAERQLNKLQDEIDDVVKSGKVPGFWDDVVSAETANAPTGGINKIYQSALKWTQGEEAKVLEGRKSIISSALVKAISGLAVTLSEDKRLQFLPRPGDSFQDLIRKASLVEDYIKEQRAGLSGDMNPRSASAPTSSSPIQIKSITLVK